VLAVVDLQFIREPVWSPGSAGRRAVGAGEEGADRFALGGRKLAGVGVYGDCDAREPPASPESDVHGRAHAGQGRSPNVSGIPAVAPSAQPFAADWSPRTAAGQAASMQALSVSK